MNLINNQTLGPTTYAKRHPFLDIDNLVEWDSSVYQHFPKPERVETTGLECGPPGSWDARVAANWGSVLYDEGKFRSWSCCMPGISSLTQNCDIWLTSYAESDDGIHWRQPDLKLVEQKRWPGNNLLKLPGCVMSVVRPLPGAGCKFLALTIVTPDAPLYEFESHGYGSYLFGSDDGLHWRQHYGHAIERPQPVPRDHWLEGWESQAIANFHQQYPVEGYRRLTFRMLDRDVVAVSPSSTYRVLQLAGLIGRPKTKPSEKGQGFVQPRRAHEHWHVDVSYLNICGTFYYLCSLLDGDSRAIVHWEVRESMKETDIETIVQRALEEQHQRAFAEGFLDELGGAPRKVSGDPSVQVGEQQMRGEVINHGQRSAVQPVNAQDADLRVNWPNPGHLVIRRAGIGVADRPVLAILESKGAVDGDAVFVTDARADSDFCQVVHRATDGIERSVNLLIVVTQDTAQRVGVRSVDQNVGGRDVQLLLDAAAQPRQKLLPHIRQHPLANSPGADGSHVHGQNDQPRCAVVQHQRLGVERVFDSCFVGADGNVALGHPGPQRADSFAGASRCAAQAHYVPFWASGSIAWEG